jgi:hypothetical protein
MSSALPTTGAALCARQSQEQKQRSAPGEKVPQDRDFRRACVERVATRRVGWRLTSRGATAGSMWLDAHHGRGADAGCLCRGELLLQSTPRSRSGANDCSALVMLTRRSVVKALKVTVRLTSVLQ